MKTKHDLAMLIMQNASEEAREMLEHASGVAKFVLEHFPEDVPERMIDSEVKSTESALLGGYREPEVSGKMMLERCIKLLQHERKG